MLHSEHQPGVSLRLERFRKHTLLQGRGEAKAILLGGGLGDGVLFWRVGQDKATSSEARMVPPKSSICSYNAACPAQNVSVDADVHQLGVTDHDSIGRCAVIYLEGSGQRQEDGKQDKGRRLTGQGAGLGKSWRGASEPEAGRRSHPACLRWSVSSSAEKCSGVRLERETRQRQLPGAAVADRHLCVVPSLPGARRPPVRPPTDAASTRAPAMTTSPCRSCPPSLRGSSRRAEY